MLIMDVVRQVVRAAQDHIDSKRASSAGKKTSVNVVTCPPHRSVVVLEWWISDWYKSHQESKVGVPSERSRPLLTTANNLRWPAVAHSLSYLRRRFRNEYGIQMMLLMENFLVQYPSFGESPFPCEILIPFDTVYLISRITLVLKIS